MTTPSNIVVPLPHTTVGGDPTLRDLLNLHKKEIFLSFNCHHLGTVQKFDPVKQTASVTINYQKTFFILNPDTDRYEAKARPYPTLIDCPVICLGGGKAALTFPIEKGDECLVLFNDRDLDNWFAGGTGSTVSTPRLHSLSDGLVLVGIRSKDHFLQNYDTTRAVLRNDKAMVGVGASLIKIANNQITLATLLKDLVTAIGAMSVSGTCPPGGGPLTLGMVSGVSSMNAEIEKLLE